MARTHSSYTASPTRFRSPQRSPARHPSQDGSQYEMDLDALGLNSTFETTELEGTYEPPADRVDTSEIEGPEDFTMNMTYWMTADLPLAQIKSRKEAKARRPEVRMDAMPERSEEKSTTEEGIQVFVEEASKEHKDESRHSVSPTMRANGTTDEREYSTPPSERSMENDEKVRSFLSALPDTDMEGALTGTPLHAPRHSFLQVPQSSPPKARSLQSLQPTVEDYDTPRKPTQQTVIHHTSAVIDTSGQDAVRNHIEDLQSRLEQQEQASKSRIQELETILSYTRSELEGARTDNYRHKERLASLEKRMEQQKAGQEAAHSSAEAELKAREDALEAKMHEFGEEMRLQNLAKLQNQQEDFEQQLRALEESKQLVDEEVDERGQALEQAQEELAQLRKSNEQELQGMTDAQSQGHQSRNENAEKERLLLSEQLASVQARANDLQAGLEKATAETRAAREDAHQKDALRTAAEAKARTHTSRISDLEGHLQTAQFELECAQADIAAKQQLFHTNIDLNSRLRTIQSELEIALADLSMKDQQIHQTTDLESRISSLQSQLESALADLAAKDEQILRHLEQQGQSEQRFHTSQGRIESLEANVTALRQQLAEAHRESAKARADAGRFEQDLEDTNDRLQDARAEADRRVMDVENRLSRMKQSKLEAENRFRELQSQRDDLVEGHEAMMEDVRDKAEDAVRKAGALLEQERSEKRRIVKDLRKAKEEVEKLAAQKHMEDVSEGDTSTTETNTKDAEIAELRDIIRKQVAEMKSSKAEASTLRKENRRYKTASESVSDIKETVRALESQVTVLRTENEALQTRLKAQEEDFEAVNKAMDEKLSSMLNKLMKERAKTVVGKRDGQWVETVGKVQTEKELLGKVLLRQWGREEVGAADEKQGERQGYAYKYVQRT